MPNKQRKRVYKRKYNLESDSSTEDAEDTLPNRHTDQRYVYVPPPLEKFCVQKEMDWAMWSRKFERYRYTSLLCNEPQNTQVSALLLAMGDEAEHVFDSFSLDNPSYNQVLENFNTYFSKSINVILERAVFNKRNQLEGESFEQYITTLHKLVKNCNFGPLKDEMIRDRLVIGVRDSKLSESLQMNPSLTLKEAIDKIKLWEAVKCKQNVDLKTTTDCMSALMIRSSNKTKLETNNFNKKRQFKCFRCGDTQFHYKEKCPVYKKRCTYCNVGGHFDSCCNKKNKELKELVAC